MSELTAAEKRQQLRERRAAKMSKASGSRLNKIVNSNGSSVHELMENDTQSREVPTANANAKVDTKTNRISQTFTKPIEIDDEPEVPSLDSLDAIPDPLHGSSRSNGGTNSVDDIFNNLIQSHQQSAQHGNPEDGPLPEDFMNTIGSIFGNGMGGMMDGKSPLFTGNNDSALKTQQGDIFAFVRYIFVSLIFYFRCVGNDFCFALISNENQKSISWFSNWWRASSELVDCSLWETFLSFECVFSVIHLMLANSNSIPKRSKDSWAGLILGFIPMQYKNALTITVDYFDVILGFWKDLCLLFVLLILKSYIFNK